MNILREKLNENKMILGTLVSLTDPCLCEIMGNIGYGAEDAKEYTEKKALKC